MKLYNTLSRQIEELKPLKAGVVSLYTCGPTVYDHVHIGNMRAFIFADLLRRVIKQNDYNLQAVMNITDVDDKTIHRSLKEFPGQEPMKSLMALTKKYEHNYLADSEAVGINLADVKLVRATEHIEIMTALIKKIHSQGFAYVADDGIYFNVEAFSLKHHYGVLSNISVDLDARERIDNDEYDKDNARDFALWKRSDQGEPSWEIEIDGRVVVGRPGWHIECSAMSTKYLSQPFDIHTGGVDLTFPHHENEIAQSKGATGQDLAKVFMHNEHLLVNGKKMSKSLENFYTLTDVTDKDINPLAFRLLMLSSHYRSQQNFTWEALDGASQLLGRLYAWADLLHQDHPATAPWLTDFNNALSDDLNTPKAIAVLTQHLRQPPDGKTLESIEAVLGLKLTGRPDIAMNIKQLISGRQVARDSGDYSASDAVRSQLNQQGIELEDTPSGPRWRRI